MSGTDLLNIIAAVTGTVAAISGVLALRMTRQNRRLNESVKRSIHETNLATAAHIRALMDTCAPDTRKDQP